jgi:TusA-related sulfurtransferase
MHADEGSGGVTAPAQRLDVRGLDCPLPLLKAKLALNALAAGGLLEVLATDPGSERDFAAFARQTGHALLESTRDGDVFRYLLRKR